MKEPSPYTAHLSKGKKRFFPKKKQYVGNDRAARQRSRYASLTAQFRKCANRLVGRTAMLVLPGLGCRHSSEHFRPVHWERKYRARPFFVLLSVGKEESRYTLRLAGATSFYDAATQKLRYMNSDSTGSRPCMYDFMRQPGREDHDTILNGEADHVLFTAANNLLQELVNTSDLPTKSLSLPKLVCLIEGKHIPIDHNKVEKLAARMPEAMRSRYKQSLVEGAEVISMGTRFADASVLVTGAIRQAFEDMRAYEDYRELLGAETANPARKILMAENPASYVLEQNGLEPGWDEAAHQQLETENPEEYKARLEEHQGLYEKLLSDMRKLLPLPEIASDSDLLDAIAEPNRPIRFSRALSDLIDKEPGTVVRAMRNTLPLGAALRDHVRDDELLSAARNPYSPLTVGAYSKIQVANTEEFDALPDYAAGGFWSTRPQSAAAQLPVWSGDTSVVELEVGDAKNDGVVPCLQLTREQIASDD